MENISTDGKLRTGNEQAARCTGSTKGQTPFGNGGSAAPHFLRHRFIPLYEAPRALPPQEKAEHAVLASLDRMAGHYGLSLMDVTGRVYPHNVLLAYWDMEKQLKAVHPDVRMAIIRTQEKGYTVSTTEIFYTGRSLYYIPVLPVHRLLHSGYHAQSADLLLSVFAYLRHVAKVPYYREQNTFLYYHYDMLKEWLHEEMEECAGMKAALKAAKTLGNTMLRRIDRKMHLKRFGDRVAMANPTGSFETECLGLARSCHALWQEYPHFNIYTHILPRRRDKDDDDGIVEIDDVISFVAENEGNLYESLFEGVNDELVERADMQQPTLIRVFDGKQEKAGDSLDAEERFYELLNKLCTLLSKMP